LGVSSHELDAMVRDFALARQSARPIVEAMDRRYSPQAATSHGANWRALGLAFESSFKPPCSTRFSLTTEESVRRAEQIAKQMNIVRIGLIGELDTLGIHVAQAFGDRSGWSSTFSSGKAETRDGARVGSIMEETEIHAQDAFQATPVIRTSFAESHATLPLINPRELDLPYDSRYCDTLEIDWSECIDLLNCRNALIPSAALLGERVTNDIYYSPRLGGKIFSSSGLGSGFSLAEATVHAAAELIERHAVRLAELELDNPGGVGVRQFWFVDHASLPETPRRIVGKYRKAGMCVRILDMTSEIAVPTFCARIFDDPFESDSSMSSDGFACHPNPEVAVTMALLEAAQTKVGVIAGGREDYSLQARSLGRHERPRTMVPQSQVFWFCNDRPVRPLQETPGFVTRDILEELEWIVDRIAEAGFSQILVVDYTMDRIRPAYVVRVTIPGLEATNPLFTGARARATMIRDLLPRRAAEAN
jgi:ribosomal protein S12 methylthiotransferase accessory factor